MESCGNTITAAHQKAEQDYFSADERYLEKDFILMSRIRRFYLYPSLDVLKEFENKGYAASFVDWLKAKYPNKNVCLYPG